MKENSKTISGNSSSSHGGPEQGYPLLNGLDYVCDEGYCTASSQAFSVKTRPDHVIRNAYAARNNEAYGLGKQKPGIDLEIHLQRTNTKPPRHHSYTID